MQNSVDEAEQVAQTMRLARLQARLNSAGAPKRQRKTDHKESVFVCYRRVHGGHAGRLQDNLKTAFGANEVFMDVEGIKPGVDYLKRIEGAIRAARVMVVVIGAGWLECTGADGKRQLDDPKDVMRHEVALGLKRKMLVLPVFVGGAKMPSEDDLPADLRDLARRNGVEVNDLQWGDGIERVIETIQAALPTPPDPQTKAKAVTVEKMIADMLIAIGNFLEQPDPEHQPGDFLIVGAGVTNDNGEPQISIEVRRGDKVGTGWIELVSLLRSKEEITIVNQVGHLKELGWRIPREGTFTKAWFKGRVLTRWWRDLRADTLHGDFDDLSKAIVKTFVDVWGVLPQGVALGFDTVPAVHPSQRRDQEEGGGTQLRVASPLWRNDEALT